MPISFLACAHARERSTTQTPLNALKSPTAINQPRTFSRGNFEFIQTCDARSCAWGCLPKGRSSGDGVRA
jgi:hypothetical protein